MQKIYPKILKCILIMKTLNFLNSFTFQLNFISELNSIFYYLTLTWGSIFTEYRSTPNSKLCYENVNAFTLWHGMYMFDFAYKLQLHYNIYRLVSTIWMVKIIKMKIPLGSCKSSYMQKETYHENQHEQDEIFKIKDAMCKIFFRKKGPTLL